MIQSVLILFLLVVSAYLIDDSNAVPIDFRNPLRKNETSQQTQARVNGQITAAEEKQKRKTIERDGEITTGMIKAGYTDAEIKDPVKRKEFQAKRAARNRNYMKAGLAVGAIGAVTAGVLAMNNKDKSSQSGGQQSGYPQQSPYNPPQSNPQGYGQQPWNGQGYGQQPWNGQAYQ
jgi:hypothetical protein